jgi:hypothetical protein
MPKQESNGKPISKPILYLNVLIGFFVIIILPLTLLAMVIGGVLLIYHAVNILKQVNQTSEPLKKLLAQIPEDIFSFKDFNLDIKFFATSSYGQTELTAHISSFADLQKLLDTEMAKICPSFANGTNVKFLQYIEEYFKDHPELKTSEIDNLLDLIKENDKKLNFDKIISSIGKPEYNNIIFTLLGVLLVALGGAGLIAICCILKKGHQEKKVQSNLILSPTKNCQQKKDNGMRETCKN